eukprot:121580-Prymnesium_polylepis.2
MVPTSGDEEGCCASSPPSDRPIGMFKRAACDGGVVAASALASRQSASAPRRRRRMAFMAPAQDGRLRSAFWGRSRRFRRETHENSLTPVSRTPKMYVEALM